VDSVAGASMFIRRRILDRIGRFDPQFFLYVEDTDICLRAWKAGFRVYYFPHIQFLHHWGGSTAWSLKSRFYHYKSMFRFFKKHGMFSKHPYLPSNHPPVSSI
jgi:GT2 family glycosyltransferase